MPRVADNTPCGKDKPHNNGEEEFGGDDYFFNGECSYAANHHESDTCHNNPYKKGVYRQGKIGVGKVDDKGHEAENGRGCNGGSREKSLGPCR